MGCGFLVLRKGISYTRGLGRRVGKERLPGCWSQYCSIPSHRDQENKIWGSAWTVVTAAEPQAVADPRVRHAVGGLNGSSRNRWTQHTDQVLVRLLVNRYSRQTAQQKNPKESDLGGLRLGERRLVVTDVMGRKLENDAPELKTGKCQRCMIELAARGRSCTSHCRCC